MTEVGPILLASSMAAPLLLVLLVPLTAQPLRLLPWAAVPALAASCFVPEGTIVEFRMILVGITLGLDRIGAVFLASGSVVWLLAGIYAGSYLARAERAASFSVYWLLTLAGTLASFAVADVVAFYASFSVLSLAAYGLIIHDRTASALRAGRIYIVLAVLGEITLLAAFMLAAAHAETLLFPDVRKAITLSPWPLFVVLGLIVGFGIKAGLLPLHVWLPLAHPEAPTPASAALSGVIVKVGIIGLLRFLPIDLAWSFVGDALVVLGLFTAYYGIAIGLMQTDAKAILAYSTLSQMGLVITVLGSAFGAPDPSRTFDAATLYASQHGLAKAALFLSVGIVAASGPSALRLVMVATAITALAIAGLPLTGGALAKLAIKDPLGDTATEFLVTISAAGTAMLMFRLLFLLAQTGRNDRAAAPAYGLVLPWAGLIVAAVAIPWASFAALSERSVADALTPANLWAGFWPILIAVLVAAVVPRLPRLTLPAVPPGDLVVIPESAARRVRHMWLARSGFRPPRLPHLNRVAAAVPVVAFERRLRRWPVSGPVLLLLAILVAIALVPR